MKSWVSTCVNRLIGNGIFTAIYRVGAKVAGERCRVSRLGPQLGRVPSYFLIHPLAMLTAPPPLDARLAGAHAPNPAAVDHVARSCEEVRRRGSVPHAVRCSTRAAATPTSLIHCPRSPPEIYPRVARFDSAIILSARRIFTVLLVN